MKDWKIGELELSDDFGFQYLFSEIMSKINFKKRSELWST